MSPSAAIVLSLLFIGMACIAVGWAQAFLLAPPRLRQERLHWLVGWSLKGLLVPLAIWGLMNFGVSWSLQPFMPQIQAAQNRGGSWFPIYLRVAVNGFFIVSSYWTAVTLAWAVARAGQGTEGELRANFKALCWTGFLGMLVPALLILMVGGWPTLGLAVTAILVPIAGYGQGILRPQKSPPMYARAVARIKFGKYAEAEWEIIHELEKCEDDFEGWMMMAELYANQFHDVAEAEQTILEICDHPNTTPSQLSVALHRLAEWHVKISGDPEAARRALQMICDRLPRSHLARMAQLRINQLPATAVELREQQSGRPIPLPVRSETPFQKQARAAGLDLEQARDLASAYVERLEREPDNVPTREKLARLLAEKLSQTRQAIEQMNFLIDMPGQDDAKRAEWLGLVAGWQIKNLANPATGRKTLERLIREFPETPQAHVARRQLQLLEDG